MSGAVWAGFRGGRPYDYDAHLAQIEASEAAWEARHPGWRERIAAQEAEYARQRAEAEEAKRALAWCRANGNPHRATGDLSNKTA